MVLWSGTAEARIAPSSYIRGAALGGKRRSSGKYLMINDGTFAHFGLR